MGMSASQVRFLSLQHRKHNIGRQLTTLSNRKMSLSRDMNQVAKNYNNALNQISLKWSNNCGVNTYALTYDLMMSPNELNTETPYIVTDRASGRVVLNNDQITDFNGDAIFDKDGKAVTYVDLAKMISGYVTCNDNSTITIDPSYITETDGSVYDPAKMGKTIADGLVYANKNIDLIYGESAVDGAYYIPKSSSDFDFDNNLRYSIFTKLGLVSPNQKARQLSLLNALYGSEQAQETGKYPVGSAWGDYYIAVANRDAYKDFLNTDQKLAISSATNNTKNNQRDYIYLSSGYQYNAHVDGAQGQSTIIQNSTTALDHVDFKAITSKDDDGNYATTYEGEGGWSSLKIATYDASGNAYDSEYTDAHAQNGSGKAYDDLYKIDVSENGITYTNIVDDIINKYVVSKGMSIATPDGNGWLRDGDGSHDDYGLYGFISDGNSAGLALHRYTNEYYQSGSGSSKFRQHITPILDCLKDHFKAAMQEEGVSVNVTALNKAYDETMRRFCDNYISEDTDSCSTMDEACSHSQDKTVALLNSQQWHLDWSGWFPSTHQAMTSYAVDATSLFTCLVTYYQQACLGDAAGTTTDGLDPNNPTLNTKNCTTGSTYSKLQSTTDLSTQYISGSKLTDSETGKTIIQETRTNVTKYIGSSLTIPGDAVHYNSSTGMMEEKGSNTSDLYQMEYVMVNDVDDDGNPIQKPKTIDRVLTYYEDKSSYTWNGTNVFGTVRDVAYLDSDGKYKAKYYYFTSQTQLNTYISSGNLSGVPYITAEVTTGAGSVNFGEDGNINGITTTIEDRRSSSTMAISLDGKVAVVDEYLAKLDNNVEKAMDRITELETELDNFYQGADKKMMDYYDALFMKIAQSGWMVDECTASGTNYGAGTGQTAYVHKGNANSATYLNNKLQNNDYFITECTEKGNKQGYKYTTKQATSILKIYQMHDTDAENQALAVYETEKAAISHKEKQIDNRMIKLETEQEAINTELDSIKKVRNDNIEKYFKIFA